MKQKSLKVKLLIAFLILDSLGVFVIWALNLASGAFPEGLLTFQEGNIPLAHLSAEFAMALITLVGAVAWLRDVTWGQRLTLFGLGMFVYSCINSLGWVWHNQRIAAIPMLLTLLVAVVALPTLLRRQGEWRRRRVSSRHSDEGERSGAESTLGSRGA